MPPPTTYSEAILADYLASALGDLADVLGWTAGSPQVQEAVTDALLEMGVTAIALVATPLQIRGLRALGRRAIWRAAVQATSAKYDFGDSDARFTRSQMHSQALESLKMAETDCLRWDPDYSASIIGVKRPSDPYIVLQDSERVP